MAGGLDSPPTSTKIETNKLAMKRFTLLSVVAHPDSDNPAMSMCYSRHSAMSSVVYEPFQTRYTCCVTRIPTLCTRASPGTPSPSSASLLIVQSRE